MLVKFNFYILLDQSMDNSESLGVTPAAHDKLLVSDENTFNNGDGCLTLKENESLKSEECKNSFESVAPDSGCLTLKENELLKSEECENSSELVAPDGGCLTLKENELLKSEECEISSESVAPDGDEFAYTKSGRFTSEIFKIEVGNLPKPCSYGEF